MGYYDHIAPYEARTTRARYIAIGLIHPAGYYGRRLSALELAQRGFPVAANAKLDREYPEGSSRFIT